MINPYLSNIVVRNMYLTDLTKIVKLQEKSFPHMLEEDTIWKEHELQSHLKIFPDGQFCVEYGSKIIGSSSSLIVKLNPEYMDHTFREITGKGLFTTHNPNGDTLYGADISVHPDFRRLGIATLLYNIRKDLAIKLNLRRIIAGGRLFNYCEFAEKMSPEEYAQKVISKEISDPVLTFQLKNGFRFIKVLHNYIKDPRSLNHASFIEWTNPHYKNDSKNY